jgi:hypothetical protein
MDTFITPKAIGELWKEQRYTNLQRQMQPALHALAQIADVTITFADLDFSLKKPSLRPLTEIAKNCYSIESRTKASLGHFQTQSAL